MLVAEAFRTRRVRACAPRLRAIANWNPVSSVTQAARELFGNTSDKFPPPMDWSLQHPVLYALAWAVLLLAVFIPLSVRQYKRAASR
ncbi:MAG TPA: hypothetical protein VIM17_07835 [Jatrophihabitantaceae bacterium]